MPSRYKTASNELLHWLLHTSGVPPTHPATITSIVDLARLIATHHPRTPLPAPIRSRFESVIRLRSAANRFWARVEARNPSAEVRAKNEAHRAFIGALEVAFGLLTEGEVEAQEEGGGNVFACLTVYATEDGEVEQLDEGADGQRTVVTPGRKRKKKKTRAKPKGGKSTALLQPTADARSAALGFMRELESLRKCVLAPSPGRPSCSILMHVQVHRRYVARGRQRAIEHRGRRSAQSHCGPDRRRPGGPRIRGLS